MEETAVVAFDLEGGGVFAEATAAKCVAPEGA